MANGRNHQPNKQDALASLKGYIFVVSIVGATYGLGSTPRLCGLGRRKGRRNRHIILWSRNHVYNALTWKE